MPDSLVAVRDRREQVIQRLSEGYAQDLLDVDELESRLDRAYGAAGLAELDALIADLAPPAAAAASTTALVPVSSRAIDDPSRLATKRVRVILSAVERRGRWSVPRTMNLSVLWGNAELDFREASLGPGVTTIHVSVFMGNFEIILPPGLAIDVDVSSLAGAVTERHRVPPDDDPSRPMLRVVGNVRFGNLEVSTRLPGETAVDTHRRERHAERRERHQRKLAYKRDRREAKLAYRRDKREAKQLRGPDKALPPGGNQ